ncbi:transcription termination/antitermination protein NusA, partial [Candidatus Dojkabacteria bacterium]|nr:transcription termination/antitermination protein NusA [Candidatus Dojkabacteria bacterium]
MALQTDFLVAVNQIAAERGIEVDDILESIKQAILAGFRRDYQEEEDEGSRLNVEIDSDDGSIAVYADKKVVEKVTDAATQISLKEAQELEPKLRVGDHVEVDITPEGDFGRVAAQSAKQVILQKLREAEKNAQIQRFINRVGEIETGIVQRMDG